MRACGYVGAILDFRYVDALTQYLKGVHRWRRERPPNSLASSARFPQSLQADLGRPDPSAKIFSFSSDPNHRLNLRHPVPREGTLAIVTNVGAGCGGRVRVAGRATLMRTVKSCGPDAPTLASSS